MPTLLVAIPALVALLVATRLLRRAIRRYRLRRAALSRLRAP